MDKIARWFPSVGFSGAKLERERGRFRPAVDRVGRDDESRHRRPILPLVVDGRDVERLDFTIRQNDVVEVRDLRDERDDRRTVA